MNQINNLETNENKNTTKRSLSLSPSKVRRARFPYLSLCLQIFHKPHVYFSLARLCPHPAHPAQHKPAQPIPVPALSTILGISTSQVRLGALLTRCILVVSNSTFSRETPKKSDCPTARTLVRQRRIKRMIEKRVNCQQGIESPRYLGRIDDVAATNLWLVVRSKRTRCEEDHG